jgi:hypothetical protein
MGNKTFFVKTGISIADFAVELGLSLVPGASIPYGGLKKIVGFVRDYNQYKNDQKIQQFVSSIFDDNSLGTIDIDDFSKVLNSCLQDMEDEKSEIYGKFCKGLTKNKFLQKDEKKDLILIIRNLTINDILFIKKLYIHAKYNINNHNGKINYLFQTNDVKINISKNKLLNYSLIDLDNNTITSFAESFIKIIFDEFELTPENIGLKEWRKIVLCIISYQLNNSRHAEIADEIEKLCLNERISTSIIAVIDKNINSAKLLFSAGVLIIDEKEIEDKHIGNLNDFSKKRPLFGINIGKRANDFFDRINFTKLYNINDNNELKIVFENIIKEYGL